MDKRTVRGSGRPRAGALVGRNRSAQADRELPAEPRVGIFWAYNGRLLVDSTPVSEGSSYGDFKIHDLGHDAFWAIVQRNHLVPTDLEYDEIPRGRVGYNSKEQRFYLFADACILKTDHLMNGIRGDLHLPADIVVGGDSHYRCPGCMDSRQQTFGEEQDRGF